MADDDDAAREGGPPDRSSGAEPAEHPVDAESKRLGYEVTDASGRALAFVMLAGVAVIAASVAGLFALIDHFHRLDAAHPSLTPQQQARIVPPGPPLQADPVRDLAAERARETALLSGFAYTDATHTRARIPITRAEALVTGRSLDPAP